MGLMPLTIVDDFYDNPEEVREFALSLDYSDGPGNFPGYRSPLISTVDVDFYIKFVNKIVGMFWNTHKETLDCQVETYFQYIPGWFGSSGWAHTDRKTSFAGVVYLTPDIPQHLGTAICKQKFNNTTLDFSIRDDFYAGKPVNKKEYVDARNNHNFNFETVLNVDNIYNRMLMYDGQAPHKENGFHGTTLEDSRLTQVFFAKVELGENTDYPLQRGNT